MADGTSLKDVLVAAREEIEVSLTLGRDSLHIGKGNRFLAIESARLAQTERTRRGSRQESEITRETLVHAGKSISPKLN